MNYHSASPRFLLTSLRQHRELIQQMIRREIHVRYRGSWFGLGWALITPLLLLAVYTFVFSEVFKSRWGDSHNDNKALFAIALFAGVLVHGLLAECLQRAPTLIYSYPNYVKKVIFPLEILPLVSVGVALFQFGVGTLSLLAVSLLAGMPPPFTTLYLPLVILPLLLVALGFGWLLSATGVFIRDFAQAMGLVTTVLMFLSPVFYPVSALPEAFRAWLMLNPLTFIIEQARDVLLWGRQPDFAALGLYTMLSALGAWLGFAWFQRTRPAFADVI